MYRTLAKTAALTAVALMTGDAVWALAGGGPAAPESRNYDARLAALRRAAPVAPDGVQQAALDSMRARIPDLGITVDGGTGTVRTLHNATGFLTEGMPGVPATTVALDYLRENLSLLGLEPADLEDYEITDTVFSAVDGTTHLYLRQRYLGIPVYNGQLQVNVAKGGRVLSVNNSFHPSLRRSINSSAPSLGAAAAVVRAARHLGLPDDKGLQVTSPARGAQRRTVLSAPKVSREPIQAQLFWLPIQAGEVRLVWSLPVDTLDRRYAWDLTVDADSGKVWTRVDRLLDATYKVYARPIESPNHTTPTPPSDARTVVTNPQNATASPQGWHSTGSTSWTIHRGNNVHAYDDIDGNDLPPASEPSCGASLACNFPINLSGAPSTYTSAAITNLFYWTNLVHDIQYQYGFNEAAGNFQVNNFGKGGLGNDDIRAEAQDGSGFNNANFLPTADGTRPRMQMFVWTDANPDRDSDLDDLVIVHEYGHGISTRQVGGPSNPSCLYNVQSPGEGWSDWLGLVYTTKAGSVGTTGRGVGTYLKNQPTTGAGIRLKKYSTSQSINDWTYASITPMTKTHDIGSVWAQALWEVHWDLVAKHGWDSNLYNAGGGKGNQRAMLYVNQGMKNTICNPTFLNARDGIIQAAQVNYSGSDVCRLWHSFANFGLGMNATTQGPGFTNSTNGAEVPSPSCAPPIPASLTVINERCWGLNTAQWAASSGATYYELYRSAYSDFRTQTLEYSGPATLKTVDATSTTYLRVRACHTVGCNEYRVGNQPATYYNGCV